MPKEVKMNVRSKLYARVYEIPIVKRSHGFMLVESYCNDSCRGCLEIREKEYSVRVFFWISDATKSVRGAGREFILATDTELEDTLLEAIVYYTPKTKYFRFDMFDAELENLVRFTSIEERVFELYYKFIVRMLKSFVQQTIQKNPKYENHSILFTKESSKDFKDITGISMGEAISEMRMLMPAT